jgi:TatD DNase family protein
MLFDAHTHLNFEEFSEEERTARAQEIAASDLDVIIDAGDCVSSSRQAIRDAEDYDWCYAAAGIHPEHAGSYTEEELQIIDTLLTHPRVVAIGEIGLDFHYGKDTKEEQIELFRKQLRLGLRHQIPIMIHTRDANQLTMDILKEEGVFSRERTDVFPKRPDEDGNLVPDARVQLHCFSGSAELAKEYIRLGATISIGGPVTFKNGRKTVEVVQQIPLEFLMTETDAPYLTPEPFRGRPNRSPYVEHVVRCIAVIKDIPYEEAADVLFRNGCRFFNIGK